MDHSEDDKRFCVYVLKESDGTVRYVGHGTKYRPNNKNRNNTALMEILHRLQPCVIQDGLSKNEAIELELNLFKEYSKTGLLLNKCTPSKTIDIIYENINNVLYYDETSPTFLRWKTDIYIGRYRTRLFKKAGDIAGSVKNSNGYIEVSIQRKTYKGHRLVWVLCNKQNLISNLVIDHIDRNKLNNNTNNLRLVTQAENMRNFDPSRVERESGNIGVLIDDERNLVIVRWNIELDRKTRAFNYRNLFPHVDLEVAKQKCIELAVWYREQILSTS